VVSSSKNAEEVLRGAGLRDRFAHVVDGNVAGALSLPGKPAPDTYVYAARLLGAEVADAVVYEDAVSGVRAGHAGGFGAVVGVDRGVGHEALSQAGASVVVADLQDSQVRPPPPPPHPVPPRRPDQGRKETPHEPAHRHRRRSRGPSSPARGRMASGRDRPGGDLGLLETLFSVANGYLGMRGTPEEGRDAKDHGTFINGFHETWQINHAESAYGFAQVGQTIVNVPDSTVMKLYVDDEPLLLRYADLEEYRRWVGLPRRGAATGAGVAYAGRQADPRTHLPHGLDDQPAPGTDDDGTGDDRGQRPRSPSPPRSSTGRDGGDDLRGGTPSATGDATSDPRRTTSSPSGCWEPQNQWHDDQRILLGWRTASSRMSLAVGADHQVTSDLEIEELVDTYEDQGKHVFRTEMPEGSTLRIEKAVAYHSSAHLPIRELFDRCRRTPGPGPGERIPARSRRAARLPHRLLGAHRRAHRRSSRRAAGDPLVPVPARAGHGPGRRSRRRGRRA
jgi:hypothetical protein